MIITKFTEYITMDSPSKTLVKPITKVIVVSTTVVIIAIVLLTRTRLGDFNSCLPSFPLTYSFFS